MKHNRFFTISKLIGFYGIALAGLFLWESGFDAAQRCYFSMVLDLLIAGFGIGFLAIMLMESWDKKLHDLVREAAPKIAKDLAGTLDEAFSKTPEQLLDEAVHKHDCDMLNAILADMDLTGDEVPTEAQLAKIAEEFHENTYRYIKFTPDGDGKFLVKFAARQFDEAHAEAAEQAAPVRKQIPVKDGDEPAETAPKKLTKSQQRRINAKKGLGPLTDDEVREQKNAKRREARAAKKAAAETTTTTIQPNQTKLV